MGEGARLNSVDAIVWMCACINMYMTSSRPRTHLLCIYELGFKFVISKRQFKYLKKKTLFICHIIQLRILLVRAHVWWQSEILFLLPPYHHIIIIIQIKTPAHIINPATFLYKKIQTDKNWHQKYFFAPSINEEKQIIPNAPSWWSIYLHIYIKYI